MRENISVCMASYNGGKYIEEQIYSILDQLIIGDELIIVDDFSVDNTTDIIKNIDSQYIRFYQNEKNIGYVKTFEKALLFAENDFICLSDQDDVWKKGRLIKLYDAMKKAKALIVASNFEVNNESNNDLKFTRLKDQYSRKFFSNIINIFKGKSAYYGCTMMIHKNLLKYVLPFPIYIETHDLWFAMSGNILRSMHHISDDTLFYRVHQNNASLRKRNFYLKLRARFYFGRMILTIITRINK